MNEFKLCETDIPRGLSVIEASAGTGKTWTLGHLPLRFIIEGRVDKIDEVLMLSFTEDSTRELAERVRQYVNGMAQLLLDQSAHPSASSDLPALIARASAAATTEQAGLKQLLELLGRQKQDHLSQRVRNILRAQLDCDRLLVSTIHALCRRVLSDEGFLCGTPSGFEVLPDMSGMKAEALKDVWRSRVASDARMAGLALYLEWKLEDDLKAWRQLDPLGALAFHGRPRSVAETLGSLKNALNAMRDPVADLAAIKRILGGDVTRLKKADELNSAAFAAELNGMDPGLPTPSNLELAKWIADAKGCIRKQWEKNMAARALIDALPLVRVAGKAAEALNDLSWAWRVEALEAAEAEVLRRLKKANALSFNDLVGKLHEALQGASGELIADRLRSRWKIALVDESQDTDPRQLAIFEKIFNQVGKTEQSLLLIGDPKQSIYGFRGADLDAYVAARDRDGVLVSSLVETFRSAKGLAEALNLLWARPQPLGSPDLELLPAVAAKSDEQLPLPHSETSRLTVALVSEAEAPQWTRSNARLRNSAQAAACAVRKTLALRVSPGDCAVLTRSNMQAEAVSEALRAMGIPAVVRDDGDVMAGEEGADLSLVMRAALRPGNQGYRRAALATRMLGFDAAALAALDEKTEEGWQLRFAGLGEVWRKRGVAAFFSALDEGGRVTMALAADPLGERRLTDLRHLAEILQAEEAARRLAADRLLEWMNASIAAAEEGSAPEARLRRLEQDGSAVQVLTVHRAKGLEFEYVFCPYLWHARVPKSGETRVAKLKGQRALTSPDHLSEDERAVLELESGWQALEEELRLAYVALTRGKRQVWMLAGWIGYAAGPSKVPPSALDWILREDFGQDRNAWYDRMILQKKPVGADKSRTVPFYCGHAERLNELEADPRIRAEAVSLKVEVYHAERPPEDSLTAATAPRLNLDPWRISSYSGLLRKQGPERDRHDFERQPEKPEAAGEMVPLAHFAKGAEAGTFLHDMLETWDFGETPEGVADKALKDFLPDLAGALIHDLGPLSRVASDKGLSEWHFVLPLAEKGISGEELARVFSTHPEPRMHEYASSLRSLAPEAVKGMLQGYIDRLVRDGKRWAVVDWKSNHLGDKAGHYTEEAMWNCAAESHYILQAHLYMIALRRYLRTRGGGHSMRGGGHSMRGSALAFLRGMKKGTQNGVLWFEAHETFLEAFEALFLGVPA